jgi:hypothetical protein
MVGERRDQPAVVVGERGRGGMPDHDQYLDDFPTGGQRDHAVGRSPSSDEAPPSASSSAPARARAVSTSPEVRSWSVRDRHDPSNERHHRHALNGASARPLAAGRAVLPRRQPDAP